MFPVDLRVFLDFDGSKRSVIDLKPNNTHTQKKNPNKGFPVLRHVQVSLLRQRLFGEALHIAIERMRTRPVLSGGFRIATAQCEPSKD